MTLKSDTPSIFEKNKRTKYEMNDAILLSKCSIAVDIDDFEGLSHHFRFSTTFVWEFSHTNHSCTDFGQKIRRN